MTRLFATPKINIGLRVLGQREDGYHLLESLFFPLSTPRDELLIEENGKGIRVECDNSGIDPERNTLTKAWKAYAGATGFGPDLKITLKKGIPSGAGLGGGSADAACLLRWLNAGSPCPAGKETLGKIAGKVGADVPFFLQGMPARIRGIGEIVEPLGQEAPEFFIVLAWPDINISSAWAYKEWDSWNGREGRQQKALTKAAGTVNKTFPCGSAANDFFCCGFANDLEPPVFGRYPPLAELKEKFFAMGAFHAGMSGSGSTIYGLFEDAADAERMRKFLREKYRYVFFARSR